MPPDASAGEREFVNMCREYVKINSALDLLKKVKVGELRAAAGKTSPSPGGAKKYQPSPTVAPMPPSDTCQLKNLTSATRVPIVW